MTVRREPADWTLDRITRFWEHQARTPAQQAEYFSYVHGRGIAALLRTAGLLHGRVLDFGCGPGYLIENLLAAGAECWGVDASPRSVACANERAGAHPRWQGAAVNEQGARTPFPDGFFDAIACVETLEHLPDDVLGAVLTEIRRVLRPGGTALFTTPHAERLHDTQVYCPFCESEFHRYQHLRTFDPASLEPLLHERGFAPLFVANIDFRDLAAPASQRDWKNWTPGMLYRAARRSWLLTLDLLSRRPFLDSHHARALAGRGGHLVALARRPQ
jgi:SAM-dependent methyltransferase